MSAPDEEFYSEERWGNWLDRLREEELDLEDEGAARLLLNLQEDVAIAVAKILRAHGEGLDEDEALSELATIHGIVLGETGIEDEETAMLVENIQRRLVCVFVAAERYIADGPADEADVTGYLDAASDAETDEEFDRALNLAAAAGTRVIDGERFDAGAADELEWHVAEWANGLASLESALSDPKVVEE